MPARPVKSTLVQCETNRGPLWSPSAKYRVRFVSGRYWIDESTSAASVTGVSSCGTGAPPTESAAQSANAQIVFFFMVSLPYLLMDIFRIPYNRFNDKGTESLLSIRQCF